MNITPKISVIVPVYNTEKYLHRCIDSILSQTFTDFELLLINDGSKDGSGDICDEYAAKDNRVRVFHKENDGANNARYYGLHKSIGLYVIFIDSDDIISPDYITAFYSEIFTTDLSVVVRSYKYYIRDVSQSSYMIDLLLCKNISVSMTDKIFKRDILLDTFKQLPKIIAIGEDLMQNLIISQKVHYVKYFFNSTISYFYRNNANSVIHSIKRNIDNEKFYYNFLEKEIIVSDSAFKYVLLQSKINGLVSVVLSGNKLNNTDDYFMNCKNECKRLNLKSLEAVMIFTIHNAWLLKKLLSLKKHLDVLLKKIKAYTSHLFKKK